MKKFVILFAVLLTLPFVYAQFDWAITDLRCGDGNIDQFELCEKGVEDVNYCEDLGKILKVASVCDTAHCTCLPRVNKAFCGNNIREGIEVCDGDGEDFCAELGNATGLNLSCNKSTCGCDILGDIPNDYNPLTVDTLENLSSAPSSCGNKKVERDEDCDPPNTLCTTSNLDAGVCTDKCKCVEPSALDESEVKEEVKEETNQTELVEENLTEDIPANDSVEVVEEKKPGFFGRFWAWIKALFS